MTSPRQSWIYPNRRSWKWRVHTTEQRKGSETNKQTEKSGRQSTYGEHLKRMSFVHTALHSDFREPTDLLNLQLCNQTCTNEFPENT